MGGLPNLGEFFLKDAPIPFDDKRAIGQRMTLLSTRQLGEGLYVSRDPKAWEWYAAGNGFKSAQLRHGTIPRDVLERIVDNDAALAFFATPGDKYDLPFRPKRDVENCRNGRIPRQLMLNLVECAVAQKIKKLGSIWQNKPPMRCYHMKYNPKDLVVAESYCEATDIADKDVEHLGENEIVVRGSNTLKFADIVAYDDSGEIIPLERRFAPSSDLRGDVGSISLQGVSAGTKTFSREVCRER